MPISNFDNYKYLVANQRQTINFNSLVFTHAAGRTYDRWRAMTPLGAVPTTAVAPTNLTLGSLEQVNVTSGSQYLLAIRANSSNPMVYVLADRLSHQGGLSGTNAATQTTNLPTAALTRSTNGIGVCIGLSIYTQIGSTPSTVTVSYTNTDDVADRTSTAVAMGGTSFREANRFIQIPLQAGDLGVKSVESVKLSNTTATTGNFGVTLYKPIYAVMVSDTSTVLSAAGYISGSTGGGIPEIPNDACLFFTGISSVSGSAGAVSGAILVGEA
jgi:hypothetical protein